MPNSRMMNEHHYSPEAISFSYDGQAALSSHDLSSLKDSSVDTDLFRMIEATDHQQTASDLASNSFTVESNTSRALVDGSNGLSNILYNSTVAANICTCPPGTCQKDGSCCSSCPGLTVTECY